MDAIQRLRYPNIELIVVDGPSTDGTYDYLSKQWAGRVKILQCPEANLSMSRNVGIRAAQGDIVAFTDDDGIPEPDWLDRIVGAYADERVGAVGGFVRNHTGVAYQTRYNVSNRHGFTDEHVERAEDLPEYGAGSFEFPRLIGVNSTFRRKALLEVGGFDEEYAYFYDEVDLAIRLIDANYRIETVPDAEVHHKYAASHIRTEKGIPRSWFLIARSTAYFCIKNRPKEERFIDSLATVDRHHQIFSNQSIWAQAHGNLTNDQMSQLLKSLRDGMKEGIRDAFAYPNRRLMTHANEAPPFLPLPHLQPKGKKYRLAFVTDLYPPRPCGGIAVFMHQLAKYLAALGHEITVITFGEPGNPHTVDLEDGVWVHRLQFEEGPQADVDIPYMPGGMKVVARKVLGELERVKAHRPVDWVIGTIWDLHVAAAIASPDYRVAMYLVTSHGLMLDSKPEWKADKHFYEEHVLKMLEAERWALRDVDLVLASTNAIKRDMEATYGELPAHKTAIQPFGIAPPDINAAPAKVADGKIRVLFVGRFETRKGVAELLDVIAELSPAHPHVEFTLIGDNSIKSPDGIPYWDKFKDAYSHEPWFSRVKATGLASDEELEAAYAGCDIFVAPSRYESFGLIYVEAMRYAKPCIGCTVGGIPEVIAEEVTGILVPPNDAGALKAAIVRLVGDADLRSRLGNAGQKRYQEQFTIKAFGEGFLEKLQNADRSLNEK
jgi:glycosyltransferase involved in cell wall biosynthesis/GT2 family glycosyltransferase